MAAQDYTIAETYVLPSMGKIYDVEVNPEVKLRSMTTKEEMKRLNPTNTPYKMLCGLIDDCIVDPIGISAYDLHLGDYQFLLHRLRVVTYGSSYPTSSVCPYCHTTIKRDINLDEIPILEFDEEEFNNLRTFALPRTGKEIKIKYQTPRMVEAIQLEKTEWERSNPNSDLNMEYLLDLAYIIDRVDGKKKNIEELKPWLEKLPMADANCIFQHMAKINEGVGINTWLTNKCTNPDCGIEYPTRFRTTSEFFGPPID